MLLISKNIGLDYASPQKGKRQKRAKVETAADVQVPHKGVEGAV